MELPENKLFLLFFFSVQLNVGKERKKKLISPGKKLNQVLNNTKSGDVRQRDPPSVCPYTASKYNSNNKKLK